MHLIHVFADPCPLVGHPGSRSGLIVGGSLRVDGRQLSSMRRGERMAHRTGLGLLPGIALLIAVASSLAFLAAGFLVPVYEEVTSTSESPGVSETSTTLVAENGSWMVLLLLFPLLATVLVALRCSGMPIQLRSWLRGQ
jgi:hypothetical protein